MSEGTRPRVLLADDHRLVAEGIKTLLEREFEIVGMAEDGLALLDAAERLHPDVVVADITMPRLNGIDAIARLRQIDDRIRIVLLTMHPEPMYVRRALDAGASGYVLKHSSPEELVAAIRAALAGRTYIEPTLVGELLHDSARRPGDHVDPVASLTPRQREILQMVAEGRTAKEIGAALAISARTVEFHKYQLMESLGLHTTADLVHFAIKHGIVSV
ncbi:MAG TPA: response regulator transcription factor [Candidatus Polarisedimenticolaceae bacterium]